MHRPHLLTFVLVVLLAGASPLTAQVVVGTVRDADDARALGLAFVTLVDTSGVGVASVLSDDDGSFRLRAPRPGRYSVRVERIGYADVESGAVDVPARGAVTVSVAAAPRALELEGIDVEAAARCSVRPRDGELTARLWDEARKALAIATWAQDAEVLRFRIVEWRRALDPSTLRVEREVRAPRTGFHGGSPFVSLPASDLQDGGYIRELEEGELEYHAPDPSVLLSDPFLDAHCFRVRADDPPEDGWIGLTFEPLDRDEVPDIEGVLWLDGASAELERVEYRYTRLPAGLRDGRVGGVLDFGRIPEGPWIVRRWTIRTPSIGLRERRDLRGHPLPPEPVLTGLNETEVVGIRTPAGSPLLRVSPSVLNGTVWDSAAARPLAGATVRLAGTHFETTADAAGRFRLQGLPEGPYTVTLEHDRLDALGWRPEGVAVELAPGDTTAVELAIPPAQRLMGAICNAAVDDEGTAVLLARMRWSDPRDAAADDVAIVLSWETGRTRLARGQIERNVSTVRAIPGDDGAFRLCGIPGDEEITLEIERQGRIATEVARVRLNPGEIRAIDIDAPPSARGGEGASEPPPRAIEVGGVSVTVAPLPAAERSLRMAGIDPASLGRRWITADEIEAIAVKRDVGEILEWRGISGSRVIRPENQWRGENMGLCVSLVRARTATGAGRCALVVVDGRRMDRVQALYLDPAALAGVAVLQPAEATVLFGVAGEAGAVMFFTREGGR